MSQIQTKFIADLAVTNAKIANSTIDLTAKVINALPIANGGTGQITASAAFNALSPITSTGDLIIGTGVNTASRLAIGANNTVLTSNGTTATWASPAAAPTFNKETFVLSGTDITNQYIDLAQVAKTNSILFQVKGSGDLLEGASYDYSVSYTGGAGGNTRITFLNDLATGGAAALVATDVVQINYAY